jgi:hypothetical protein
MTKQLFIGLTTLAMLTGCRAVFNANSTDPAEMAGESSVVVVRPDRYTLLGTRSMQKNLEVVYEEMTVNAAGQPVVKLGLRNRGGEQWYDWRAPDFTLYAQVAFYEAPVIGTSARQAPLYRTNKQPVPMPRGETIDLSFTSPVKGAGGYQVTLSEN